MYIETSKNQGPNHCLVSFPQTVRFVSDIVNEFQCRLYKLLLFAQSIFHSI